LLVGAIATSAFAGIELHVTCAGELARDATHLRMLRSELAKVVDGMSPTSSHTLDVALVRLEIAQRRSELEVTAELRAMLSDDHGRVIWTSSLRSTARGAARDRAMIQRDAIGGAADQLGRQLRSRCAGSACR
jgi:hypothetical protein